VLQQMVVQWCGWWEAQWCDSVAQQFGIWRAAAFASLPTVFNIRCCRVLLLLLQV
jgi:hypothetical protein